MPVMQARTIGKDFYTYSTFTEALAPSTSATTSIQIEADSDFEIIKMAQFTIQSLGASSLDESTRVIPVCNVLLIDTGSGRQLMDEAIPITSLFGTAERPFILPQPRTFLARSVIQVQFSNLSTSVTYARISLAFIGSKIFSEGFGYGAPG